MSFASTQHLWIVIVSLLVFCFAYYLQKKKQHNLANWIKRDFWPTIIPEFSFRVFYIRWISLALCLFLLLISLLRPQWGEKEELIDGKGMDIIFILDLSNSMLAEDVNPSRLNRAQTMIKKTLVQLADDRVGVVAFAGNAFLAIPLTTDFGYVGEVVDTLNPDAIASQGTEIGTALDVAVNAFERGGADTRKTSRAIVLISDGEDFGKGADGFASKVKEFGAGFFAFSVGTTEGAPIPLRADGGILQTYKKDRSGKTILSKTNPSLMNKISSSAGGKFFELNNVDDAAYVLTKNLMGFQRESTKEQRLVTKTERFQIFLALGMVFFIIHLFAGYTKGKAILLVIFITGALIDTQAGAQTLRGYLRNKDGVNHYNKNDFEAASKSFEAARAENAENTIMEFNQATALAKAKKNEDALYHYGEVTKKSLGQGDFEMAAKSLYNQGLIQKESKNFKESYQSLTGAVEMAKISNQPELEKNARLALLKAVEEQKKDQQQKDNEKKDGSSQSTKGSGGGKSEDKKSDKKDDNNDPQSNKNQNTPEQEDGKRREFKSGTLSKDVAEGIMSDLSDREKQLYQRRMKERKTKESPNEQDW